MRFHSRMMPVLILNKTVVSMQRQRGVFLVGGRVSNRMDTKDVISTSTEKEHMGTVHEGACEVIEKPRSIDFILCSGAFLRRKKERIQFRRGAVLYTILIPKAKA